MLLLISLMLFASRMITHQKSIFIVFAIRNVIKYSLLSLVMMKDLATLLNTKCCHCPFLTMMKKGNACSVVTDVKWCQEPFM